LRIRRDGGPIAGCSAKTGGIQEERIMKDFVRKSMLFGVGLAMATREKVESVVDDMIAKGEMSEKEGKETVHALIEKSEEVKKDLIGKGG
jgi:polyhydroxyalkanoate synthesis regulator phasin